MIDHIDSLAQVIADIPDLVTTHAPWITGSAALLALSSEIFPRLLPIRDRRTDFLARLFDVESQDVIPIGDGIQLWHDAAHKLRESDPESSVPMGAPTLKASYVIRRQGNLFLLCVHNTEEAHVIPDPDDPDYRDGVIALFDHMTGHVHPGQVPLTVDEDCIRRTNLVEAIANTRFGYQGPVTPLILWKDPQGLAPEPEDERSLSLLKPTHLELAEGRLVGSLPEATGGFAKPKGFAALSSWLRRQPGRTTPRALLLLRAGLVAGCIGLIAASPQFAGHEQAKMLIDRASQLLE